MVRKIQNFNHFYFLVTAYSFTESDEENYCDLRCVRIQKFK